MRTTNLLMGFHLATLFAIGSGCVSTNTDQENSNEFQDCAVCPVMVNLPAGEFMMGTAVEDRLTDPRTSKPATNDSPAHMVSVPEFALGKFEVSVAEYAAFVSVTGHETVNECMEFSKPGSFTLSKEFGWNNPGFDQDERAPVGCVSFFDAQAYAAWLSEMTGENYRLPFEAEWEYATRAGSTGPYFWGDDPDQSCVYANVRTVGAFTISQRQVDSDKLGFACDDGYPHSAPVGSYRPNGFGLFDTQGNNWEWVTDCNHKNYDGAPGDGSAWQEDDCQFGIMRGGSYLNVVERSSATVRAGRPRSGSATNMGFRVAKGATAVQSIAAEEWVSQDGVSDGPASALFNDNCAACHGEATTFRGVYGTSSDELFSVIRDGGNNVMSMPAFADRLTDDEIRQVADHLIEQNNW